MILTTVDIETTGLDKSFNDIVQFAFVRSDESGRIFESGVLYFYQDSYVRTWSEDAEAVHGISLDFLKQFRDNFDVNCKKMWLTLYRSNVVTFNGKRFDVPFIGDWLTRKGYPFVNDAEPLSHYDVLSIMRSNRMTCKLVEAPDKLGVSKDVIKLLADGEFKQEESRPHNAGYDVISTLLCLMKLKGKGMVQFQQEENTEDTHSIDESLDAFGLSEKTPEIGNTYFFIQDDTGYSRLRLCKNVASAYQFIEPVDSVDTHVFVKTNNNEYTYGKYKIVVTPTSIDIMEA